MAGSGPRIRIIVPQRSVSGGLDSKFETDPYDVKLHSLMTPEQYTEAIENLNEKLRKSRAGKIDGVLLGSSIFVVPLAFYGARHRSRTKKRKKLLMEGIHDFNTRYPHLMMRWNRRPQSFLTIEARPQSNPNPNTQMVEARVIANSGTGNYQPPHQYPPQQYPPQQYPPQQQAYAATTMQQPPVDLLS